MPLPDELNPKYALQTMDTRLLAQFVRGEIDIQAVASAELAGRGLDEWGRWVGFETAAKLHENRMAGPDLASHPAEACTEVGSED